MPKTVRRIATSAVLAVSLAGCGSTFFSNRTTNPAVWDWLGNYQALSTEAGRRTIFIRGGDNNMVCAEPPPDALEAYADAFSAAAKASGSGPVPTGTITVDTSANVARTVATSTAPFLYRTQGLQLMRDATFNLCIMLMNGVINKDQYVQLLEAFRRDAVALINNEKAALEIAANRNPASVTISPTLSK